MPGAYTCTCKEFPLDFAGKWEGLDCDGEPWWWFAWDGESAAGSGAPRPWAIAAVGAALLLLLGCLGWRCWKCCTRPKDAFAGALPSQDMDDAEPQMMSIIGTPLEDLTVDTSTAGSSRMD
jgi:hypothetical protein